MAGYFQQFVPVERAETSVFCFYKESSVRHKETILQMLREYPPKPIIICATSALGVGINPRNVRTAIHYGFPGSYLDLIQEGQRAGRDGSPAIHIIFSSKVEVERLDKRDKKGKPLHVDGSLIKQFISEECCRRRFLLGTLLVDETGQGMTVSDTPTGSRCCDNCSGLPVEIEPYLATIKKETVQVAESEKKKKKKRTSEEVTRDIANKMVGQTVDLFREEAYIDISKYLIQACADGVGGLPQDPMAATVLCSKARIMDALAYAEKPSNHVESWLWPKEVAENLSVWHGLITLLDGHRRNCLKLVAKADSTAYVSGTEKRRPPRSTWKIQALIAKRDIFVLKDVVGTSNLSKRTKREDWSKALSRYKEKTTRRSILRFITYYKNLKLMSPCDPLTNAVDLEHERKLAAFTRMIGYNRYNLTDPHDLGLEVVADNPSLHQSMSSPIRRSSASPLSNDAAYVDDSEPWSSPVKRKLRTMTESTLATSGKRWQIFHMDDLKTGIRIKV
ncbi:hypothetical protein HDU96_003378 [Phlyctochytrium bullatum]|nr:hypothetical protein HDU96_003378 [Phlyctochytrium bullatum]